MRAKLEYIFSYLDNNAIQYFLLRPIDLNNHIEDIDLIIPKQDFMKLIKVLDKDSKKVHFKYSNANESIQLFVNDILLDITNKEIIPQRFVTYYSKSSLKEIALVELLTVIKLGLVTTSDPIAFVADNCTL